VIWGERRKAAAAQAEPASVSFNGGRNGYSVEQIEQIVREGAPAGTNRSDLFHAIVGHYIGCGWDVERIYEHLQQFPDGVGSKYLAECRLTAEIARSAHKCGAAALPLFNTDWTGNWQAPQSEMPTPLPDESELLEHADQDVPADLHYRNRSSNRSRTQSFATIWTILISSTMTIWAKQKISDRIRSYRQCTPFSTSMVMRTRRNRVTARKPVELARLYGGEVRRPSSTP